MIVLIAQHVPFEGPGMIADLLSEAGHRVIDVPLYDGASLPPPETVEAYVSMGGPMSVHDGRRYPWLVSEQRLMAAVHAAGRPVLGICLGAQQLAVALGGGVVASPEREIGWFPVEYTGAWLDAVGTPPPAAVLHWHGEMIRPPVGTLPVGQTPGCPVQGFFLPDAATVGLQFHLEMDGATVRPLVDASADELAAHADERFVTPAEDLLEGAAVHATAARGHLRAVLRLIGL